MFFIGLLILSTLSIAGSAAFFSIYGLAQIFTGSFWPVVIMASSLEAGKLVSASFLYRYWTKISLWMKAYLIVAIFVLMAITSAGIFGFLSSAYQEDVLPLEQMEKRIELYDARKVEIGELKDEFRERLQALDAEVAAIASNQGTNKRKMRAAQKDERVQINADLNRLSTELQTATTEQHELQTTIIQQRVHTGPIIFIAKVFNSEVDDATKWMILLIIFAFDPLAVILTIGANLAVIERKGGREYLFYRKPSPDVAPTEVIEAVKGGSPVEPAGTIVIHQGMDTDEMQKILDERFSKAKELTPEQQVQKSLIEEQLRKKRVTERVRTGK